MIRGHLIVVSVITYGRDVHQYMVRIILLLLSLPLRNSSTC